MSLRNKPRTALIVLALGTAIRCLAAEDTFDWVPAEAKANDGGGIAGATGPRLPVVHTVIPKPTARRADYRNAYTIELERFGISNDGTHPVETSKGINAALQHAKQAGKNLIVFPPGTYLISCRNDRSWECVRWGRPPALSSGSDRIGTGAGLTPSMARGVSTG